MKKMGWLIIMMCCLVGCRDAHFAEINPHQNFIASVNILEPSLSFFDEQGEALATWDFEMAYTGATLVQQDRVLMYGHELAEAHLYELSSGKKIKTIDSKIGTTNAYFDVETQQFFMTNSKRNTVTSYDLQGKEIATQKLYNYPMSMTASEGKLYVINYKDTILSVLDAKNLAVLEEWPIENASHGLLVVEDEIWIGGHGQGSRSNDTVDIYDKKTGQWKKEVITPLMPIGFSRMEDEVAVVSHGENTLYEVSMAGEVQQKMKIGANPFAVSYFSQQIVVAGYDDAMLYFVQGQNIKKQVPTKEGPFQLLVREVTK